MGLKTTVLQGLLLAGLASSCQTYPLRVNYDPRPPELPPANVAAEVSALATSLEERASLRTSLGTARVVVEDLEILQPREARYRYAVLEERDVRAVQATVRHELEMSLGNRLNVVDRRALQDRARDDAELERLSGATHAVTGTLLREGGDVEIALRLVDLRDGWIVATAQRRIERFVARDLVPLEETARTDPRQRTAEVEEAPRGETLTVVDDLPIEPPVEAEPEGDVFDDGVPLDAIIEFDAGPAASRLEALLGPRGGAPDDR